MGASKPHRGERPDLFILLCHSWISCRAGVQRRERGRQAAEGRVLTADTFDASWAASRELCAGEAGAEAGWSGQSAKTVQPCSEKVSARCLPTSARRVGGTPASARP